MNDDNDEYQPCYPTRTRTAARLWLGNRPGTIFGDLPDEIGKAICYLTVHADRKHTTADIKARLAEQAAQFGAHCHSSGGDGKELLYDVVWTTSPSENGDFRDVYLICETEIKRSKQAIFEDFRKLLIGKAPMKVMVFALGNPEHHLTVHTGRHFREEMRDMIFRYRNTEVGEVYILIELGPAAEYEIIRVSEQDLEDNDLW
jgi:hypothetical protein